MNGTAAEEGTILIVDDEPQNRRLLELLLRSQGYTTCVAESGQDALDKIDKDAPDLVLLDVMMPKMDGYAVARALKGKLATAHIPIIMLTAHLDREARMESLDAGAEEFLSTPVDRAELWLRVRNLLRLKRLSDTVQNHRINLENEVRLRTADLQRFRTAMDASADAIFLTDRATMLFVEVNATATVMLGYSRAELLARGPLQLINGLGDDVAEYDALIEGRPPGEANELQIQRKDGSLIDVEVQRQVLRSDQAWIIVAIVHDITERKDAQRRLHRMAHYDELTRLPNRTLFFDTLTRTLEHAHENGWKVIVMCIDIDHFKIVNDTMGHAAGDELLRQFSDRLMRCIRMRDTAGRLGGDEFALILAMQHDIPGAIHVSTKIHNEMREPFMIHGHSILITSSIGITVYPDDAAAPEVIMKHADSAMYRAKQAGRDTYRFYTAQMNVEATARLELEGALRHAVEAGEFVIHYQPKVFLKSGKISGVEALLRWERPGFGLISPAHFIPVLEETGLIVPVGIWVLNAACGQIAQWRDSSIGALQVSVNVSPRQFLEGELDADVVRALERNGIAPEMLELELTESSLMNNTTRTIACLQVLKQRGVRISIDDFGTGYSSLAYLRRFPVDKLKIDIAFIRDITTNPEAATIALAIIRMAHSLKLDVIAEGVETAAQLSYLRRHHCDEIQGYYFSRPLALAQLETMLREDKSLPMTKRDFGESDTLLVVDDDSNTVDSLSELLKHEGYRVLTATTGERGLELMALHRVQVILCDQRMPDMSGNEFFDRAKHLYPDTVRIVLSGYTDTASILEAVNRGSIYRFYTKPWDGVELLANIREAVRHYWSLREPDDSHGIVQGSPDDDATVSGAPHKTAL